MCIQVFLLSFYSLLPLILFWEYFEVTDSNKASISGIWSSASGRANWYNFTTSLLPSIQNIFTQEEWKGSNQFDRKAYSIRTGVKEQWNRAWSGLLKRSPGIWGNMMVFSNNQKLRFFEIFSCQNKLPNILGFFSKSI